MLPDLGLSSPKPLIWVKSVYGKTSPLPWLISPSILSRSMLFEDPSIKAAEVP